jgi:hypothetical protein
MIFSKFSPDDIVVGRINQVSSGLFGTGSLFVSQSTFVTQSGVTGQANQLTGSSPYDVRNGQYYLDIYSGGDIYFDVAYGDYANSGSSLFDVPSYATPVLTNETKVIYSQYKNTLLQPGDNLFTFASGSVDNQVDSEAIYVLNFSADKFKDQIDPGQIQICFSGSVSPKKFTFIDDSQIINKKQNSYNLISGSIVNGIATAYLKNGSPVYAGIGLVYPSNGIIVLNAINLDKYVGITSGQQILNRNNYSNSVTSTNRSGYWKVWTRDLYNSLRRSKNTMGIRKSEFVPSTNYFVRVKNKEFNYSNNPTFVSDGTDGKTKGTIIYQDLINNPRTYITSVGLYDDNNELLAIGKISQPTMKSFDNELLIKVRIDF